ncbi:hypothetical protein [Diaphorobacter nitroreducens]|uniref:hypothetical protein n=1 Tax=Diaphorobacter nitroreducens TaxID=164759 RepID=UPI0028A74773|nr:hypothetical protein [Diaphorobacter nitroreducens]
MDTQPRPVPVQHYLRPDVHAWAKEEAHKQERSLRWFVSKLIEEAFTRAHSAQQAE